MFCCFILVTVLSLLLHRSSGFAVCNLSVRSLTVIYTSAASVQCISLVTKGAVPFSCCDFFITGIYFGAVTVVHSVLPPFQRQLHTAWEEQPWPPLP